MIQKDKTYNLATFFCLYIAQTIPMSFFSTVIPVMMRQEDFSLSAIGLLQLIKLPWILKFLWSPMVDRHAVTTGDYKRWIFSSELIYAGLIFAVAFLDFHTDFYTIVALIIISFVASATRRRISRGSSPVRSSRPLLPPRRISRPTRWRYSLSAGKIKALQTACSRWEVSEVR